MKIKPVTKSKYAEMRGCAASAVTKAIQGGRISTLVVDGREMIDPEVADIQWQRNTRARVSRSSAPAQLSLDATSITAPELLEPSGSKPAADPGYMQFRSRREQADAQIAEMNAAKMSGTMLMRQDVDRAMFEIGREIRDRLTACARRIASEVASVDTAEACESIVDREHRIVLELLVTSLREKIGVPAKDDL